MGGKVLGLNCPPVTESTSRVPVAEARRGYLRMAVERYDAIVVGAGPAGSAAALTMARAGVKVLVIERGDFAGAKNVMGGVLYSRQLADLFPAWPKDVPVERPVTRQEMWLLDESGSALRVGHQSARWGEGPPHMAYTVLRSRFDRWFAAQAEAAGALLVTETVVEDLLKEGDRVVGVRTGRPDGDVFADVVILADGVNSILAPKAGLRPEWPPEKVALAVKEIIVLPREKIEDRFNLEDGQGATIELVGDATRGTFGMGWIYTNRDSISLGIGSILADFVKLQLKPYDILEHMKAHPAVRKLVQGGEPKEYMAHLIPEGGFESLPRVYGDGYLMVGDTAGLVNVIHREGSNLAMKSGELAGQAVVEAKERGDFSSRALRRYHERLAESFILQDLKKYRRVPEFLNRHRELFTTYPALLNRVVTELFTVDGKSIKEKEAWLVGEVRREVGGWGSLARLGWEAYRAFVR